MILELYNTRTEVFASSEEHTWLSELLTFSDKAKSFVRQGGKLTRVEPPQISLVARTDGIYHFPAGLTAFVKTAGIGAYEITVVDKRTRPTDPDFSVETPWVRPYQREAAETAVRKTRGIIKLPTGTGKTEISVAISMLLPGAKTLMVTPEMDLMYNAARRYELRAGETSGVLGDGRVCLGETFTACTLQTLAADLRRPQPRLTGFLSSVDVLIVDEVHQLPADSFYSAAQAIPAYWRIGLSGTPLARGDKKSLFSLAATGSVIYEKPPAYFIERGWMSSPKIKLVEVRQGGASPSRRASYVDFVVKSEVRNRYLARIAQEAAKPALLFVREKKHGHEMVRILKTIGLKSVFIWGDKSMSQRDEAIRKLTWGDLDVLVCNKVFVTGTDIPDLRSIINGMGGKSVIETLQRLGRGTRVTDTKKEFEMWDILDTRTCGVGCGNRWNHTHSRDRQRTYVQEGYNVLVVKDFVA